MLGVNHPVYYTLMLMCMFFQYFTLRYVRTKLTWKYYVIRFLAVPTAKLTAYVLAAGKLLFLAFFSCFALLDDLRIENLVLNIDKKLRVYGKYKIVSYIRLKCSYICYLTQGYLGFYSYISKVFSAQRPVL